MHLHPIVRAELETARTADLRRAAQRDQLVHDARHARRARSRGQHTSWLRTAGVLARRAVAALTHARPVLSNDPSPDPPVTEPAGQLLAARGGAPAGVMKEQEEHASIRRA